MQPVKKVGQMSKSASMVEIALNRGRPATVCACHYDLVKDFHWYIDDMGYAVARPSRLPKVYMHRLVNQTPPGQITDHINRDPLDNRCSNLRTASKSENAINTGMRRTNTSGYKGVWKAPRANGKFKWYAEARVDNIKHRLGCYDTPEEAYEVRLKFEATL